MIEIGTNFWNLRASFTFVGGLIDIGNHMSLIRLSTGRFLVVDTCEINAVDKQKISTLTNNGELIDAVLATHPFHTMYFKPFKRMFPASSIKYYGCPRHLRNLPEISWTGSLVDGEIMKSWENEGVFLRLPSGLSLFLSLFVSFFLFLSFFLSFFLFLSLSLSFFFFFSFSFSFYLFRK
jgi:hypothetical protein